MATVSIDPAILSPAFGIFVGFDDRIRYLHQKGLEIATGAGDTSGLRFLLLWSFPGQQPAQETRCFAEGKTDISTPISEKSAMAVIGAAEKPGTVRINSNR